MSDIPDYAELSQAELDRADMWANRDGVDRDFRTHMVEHCLDRAMIYAVLAISQQISGLR